MTGGPQVFIKCYSRALYLDRCLRSVKRHLPGHGPITLLDDGMAERFIARIAALHPDVTIAPSPRAIQRRAGRGDPADYDPARFWVERIGAAGQAHVAVLEEDTWLLGDLPLAPLLPDLARRNVLYLRLYLGGYPACPETATVVDSLPMDGGQAVEFYRTRVTNREEAYRIFGLAHGLYRADYWAHAYRCAASWTDEIGALTAALDFCKQLVAARLPFCFARVRQEMIRHSPLTTSRADSGGIGIRQPIDAGRYTTALDEAWLAGEIDPMDGFPGDFGPDRLAAIFARAMPAEDVAAWHRWRENYRELYERLGINFD